MLGHLGEDFSQKILEDRGFVILERNYRTRFGEIDLIATKEGVLHFIEVKTRSRLDYGRPCEAVNGRKQGRIRLVAQFYIGKNQVDFDTISFDVIEIGVNFLFGCF